MKTSQSLLVFSGCLSCSTFLFSLWQNVSQVVFRCFRNHPDQKKIPNHTPKLESRNRKSKLTLIRKANYTLFSAAGAPPPSSSSDEIVVRSLLRSGKTHFFVPIGFPSLLPFRSEFYLRRYRIISGMVSFPKIWKYLHTSCFCCPQQFDRKCFSFP